MPESTKATHFWPGWASCLTLGLCLLPAIVLAVLLRQNAVNVPYWDEWLTDIAGVFVKFSDGTLTFGDLWAQHNESRLVLPRLLYLALGRLTHGNVCYEMACTFLLACLAAGLIFWLGRKSFADQPSVRWSAFFITSLLLFSPVQFEAWLWGMELILYLPLVCLLASLLLVRTALNERKKTILCAGLAMIGTYSFSNGLLVWMVLFPMLFLADGWPGLLKKSRAATGWVLGFFANAALYFYDFKFLQSPGSLHQLWMNPWPACEYLFAFLGAPLVVQHIADAADHPAMNLTAVAATTGGVLLMLFAITGGLVFRWRKNSVLMTEAWPWLTLGGYGVLSGLLATGGRVAMGADPEQALSSRYAVFGICLIVALIHLVPLLALHRPLKEKTSRPMTTAAVSFLATLGATVILLHALAFPPAVLNMSAFHLNRLQAKSCLKFLDVLPPQPATSTTLYPRLAELKQMADALDQRGWFDYPLLRTRQLSGLNQKAPPGHLVGLIEYCQQIGNNMLIQGWALSATHHRPADCIVFTYQSEVAEPTIFSLFDNRLIRPDLVQEKKDRAYLFAGWQKTVPLSSLPKGSLLIRPWVYDVENDTITPLSGDINLENK